MPDIEKINKFKREILDDVSDERAKKERFGIKMDIEPPKDGELIVPWENQEEVFDVEEESDDELDLDAILGVLDSEEGLKNKANENDIEILKDSKKVDIDPEFNDLDNDFDILNSNLENNIETVLDNNSISLDDAINFDVNNADNLQNLDVENDLNSDLLNSDKFLDNEIGANDLNHESLNDNNDDFDFENMITSLNKSDETNNRLEIPYSDESVSNENSEKLSDAEEDNWSNLSDDFQFLEDEPKNLLLKIILKSIILCFLNI